MEKDFTGTKALVALMIVALGSAVFLQYALTGAPKPPRTQEVLPLSLLVPTSVLEAGSLGFRNAIADTLWVLAIQNFSGYRGTELLPRYLDRITAIDPKFERPYLVGIMFLPWYGRMDEAQVLADRGMAALPENWEIPFYLGAQYHINNNLDEALRLVTLAADKPAAPILVRRMQAVYAARTGALQTAKAFFATIHETTDDDSTREFALDWLKKLDAMEALQTSIYAYHGRFGTFPDDVGEIVRAGIIGAIPAELEGFSFSIDGASGMLRIKRK
ncbi:MAG: hypothetical protein Q8Q39_00080 [bacterium]|nr:hypothetical protein [bacterium]